MDFSVDFDSILATAKKLGEAEQAKVTAKKRRKSTRKGKTRPKKAESPLTKNLIYRVMDSTDKTVYFVQGLGKTEELVEELEEQEHTLYQFKETVSGKRIQEQPYQCILSNHPATGLKRYYWQPGTEYTRCKILNAKGTKLGLFRVENWPTIPGGIRFKLAREEGETQITKDDIPPSVAGKFERMEREDLFLLKHQEQEKYIISQVTDERNLLDAVELVLNCHFSETAKRQALHLLREGTIEFPKTYPEDLSQVSKAKADQQKIEQLEGLVKEQESTIDTLRRQVEELQVRLQQD